MAETDMDLSCEFLESALQRLKSVYGESGIPFRGRVEISPSPVPLSGPAPQDTGEEE